MTEHRVQIIERLAEVATALDTRDWDALGSLFTEDADGYGAAGRDEIVARVRSFLGGCGPSQHLLGNHRVELGVDDDRRRARSRTYGRIMHLGARGSDMEGLSYECFGEYTDLWVSTADGWRLESRRFHIDFDQGDFGVLRPD